MNGYIYIDKNIKLIIIIINGQRHDNNLYYNIAHVVFLNF